MKEKQIRVIINPALNKALGRIIRERRLESPDRCINEILEICTARSVYLDSRKMTPHAGLSCSG
jgi:hypothetical protein